MKKATLFQLAAAAALFLSACGNKATTPSNPTAVATPTESAPAPAASIDVSKHPVLSKLSKAENFEAFAKAVDAQGTKLSSSSSPEEGIEEQTTYGHGYWINADNQVVYVTSLYEKWDGEGGSTMKDLYVLDSKLNKLDSISIQKDWESATQMDRGYITFKSMVAAPALTINFEAGEGSYYQNTDEGNNETWVLGKDGKFSKTASKPYSRKFIEE